MVGLTEESFGAFKGETVKRFTWTSDSGVSVSVISYGAIIQSIKVPDLNGEIKDIVLGHDSIEGYSNRYPSFPYFGATVGRCANRIGGATFEIDGTKYQLAKNIGNDHLHGGLVGFDQKNWLTTVVDKKVTFSYLSKDGEEGYPGDLITNVTYELKDDDTFHYALIASTTKKTVINLTNHSYFNLAGHDAGSEELYNHVVAINADKITETTSQSIPTGKLINVVGPYDLRAGKRIGDLIDLKANRFDDNFCVKGNEKGNAKKTTFVSRVTHPSSGRFLEVHSNQPGVQLYTGNFLPAPEDKAIIGKDGAGYRRHGALCLETQNYPDAVHHDNFPSSILVPGEIYEHLVEYKLGAGVYGKDDVKTVVFT